MLSTRVGDAATTYELNRDHLAADAVIALAQPGADPARARRDVHRVMEAPPVYAALFGSWARSRATVDSDVDLFLVRPDEADDTEWEAQVVALQQVVSRWTGNDARPFVIDESDLPERADSTRPPIDPQRRRPLFGDPSWFRKQVMTAHTRRSEPGGALVSTHKADATIRAGRLAKANQFAPVAHDVLDLADEAQDVADAFATLAVHAGIAASDVICSARLGAYHQGDRHEDAIALLSKADARRGEVTERAARDEDARRLRVHARVRREAREG